MSNRFFHRLTSFSPEVQLKVIQFLTTIDSLSSQWKTENKLSPQLINRLQQSVLVTSTGASTRIEGSLLSDEEVKNLYKKLRIQKFRTRDEQEVGGYLETLQLVFENWETMNFSENLIKQLHHLMMQYAEKDQGHKGNYKFGSNRVEAKDGYGNLVGVIFDPTPPYLVPKEMQELVDWTKESLEKKEIHPLLVIGNFVFEYLAIHPFQDGNGRTSRILTNLLLLKAGYRFTPFVSQEKIIEENKVDYYQALNTAQRTWKTENEDISSWVLFFFEVVKKQAQLAVELLDATSNVEVYLSEKQKTVWNLFEEYEELSRGEIVSLTNYPVSTVKQIVSKLQNMNVIEKVGEGRASRYTMRRTEPSKAMSP